MVEQQSNPLILYREIEDLRELPKDFHKEYHTHLFCHRGEVTFAFNGQQMKCKRNCFVFWFAGSVLGNISCTENFKATVVLVREAFLYDNVPDQGWGINATLHSRIFPVKDIQGKEDRKRILSNFKWLYQRFRDSSHRFYNEALTLQMKIFILDMWETFANDYEQRKYTVQTGSLYEQFMYLVQEHCMTQREVQFYSAKLHITPKYLNHICKITSGTTASEWIQRFTKEHLIFLLQNTDLNASEIADKMEFSSRSFFSRYVKKLLGATPSAYRKRLG